MKGHCRRKGEGGLLQVFVCGDTKNHDYYYNSKFAVYIMKNKNNKPECFSERLVFVLLYILGLK